MQTTAGELAAYMFFIIMLATSTAFAYEGYSRSEGTNARTLLGWASIVGVSAFGGLLLMTGLYIIFSEVRHHKSMGRMAAHIFALLSMGAVLTVGILCVLAAMRLDNHGSKDTERNYTIIAASLALSSVILFCAWSIYNMSKYNKRVQLEKLRAMRMQETMNASVRQQPASVRRGNVMSPATPSFEPVY